MSRKIEVGTETFVRFWLVILGFGVLGLFLWRAKTGLLIVGLSIFLAIAIQPLALKLRRLDKNKNRHTLSSILAVVIVVLAVGLIIGVVGPVVVNETTRFLSQAPGTFEMGLDKFSSLDDIGRAIGIENLSEQIVSTVSNFSKDLVSGLSGVLVSSVSTIASVLTGAVLIIVLTTLFLLEGPAILDYIWKAFAIKNKKAAEVSRNVITKMANVIAKYVSGQLMVAILDGVVSAIVVAILALIFDFSLGLAIPMGLITMIFYMVPMFGAVISCILVALVLFFSNPWAALAFAIFYIIYQQIENNIIAPKIQGNVLQLPPVLVLVAMTIGMYMFGLLGAIISVPIAGCLKVLLDEYPNIKALRDKE